MNSDTPIGHLYWPGVDAFGFVFPRRVIPSPDEADATPKDNIHDQKVGGGYVDYLFFDDLEMRVMFPEDYEEDGDSDEGIDWATAQEWYPHVFECTGECFISDNHDTVMPEDYARAFVSLGYDLGYNINETESEEEDAESSEDEGVDAA